jgi:hypothetical protein
VGDSEWGAMAEDSYDKRKQIQLTGRKLTWTYCHTRQTLWFTMPHSAINPGRTGLEEENADGAPRGGCGYVLHSDSHYTK